MDAQTSQIPIDIFIHLSENGWSTNVV